MLAKRIIPCLDVKNGKVIKGSRFQNHLEVGDIIERAEYYNQSGADELVFYDITASSENRLVDKSWVKKVAQHLNIPFCVAGGIRSLEDAEIILNSGADKISINSPALENPELISLLAKKFGSQCITIGVDSLENQGKYYVCQYTGSQEKMKITNIETADWIKEVQARGAGEVVLNCMNQDGIRNGYDIAQLKMIRNITNIPLIASGGAGTMENFLTVFQEANVSGALAASVFHSNYIAIPELKKFLYLHHIEVRI